MWVWVMWLWAMAGAADAPEEPLETDLPTVLAVGATAYVAGALIHEGLGHGGACLAVGGRLRGVSLANAGCDGITAGQGRLVAMGGALGNTLMGGASAAWLLARPPSDPATRAFLVLHTAVNLQQAAGYLTVGPWLPVGDWGTGGVLAGVERPFAAQLGLSATGVALSFGSVMLTHHLAQPLWGRGAGESRGRMWALTLAPYLLGSSLVTFSSLANRAGPEFAVSAAVANFAGTLFLAYIPLFFRDEVFRPGSPRDVRPVRRLRSRPWAVIGTLAAVGAVAAFAPGIGSYDRSHPLDPSAW